MLTDRGMTITLGAILSIILIGVLIGLVLWLVSSFVPMEPRIKQAVLAVGVVLFVIWAILVVAGAVPAVVLRSGA